MYYFKHLFYIYLNTYVFKNFDLWDTINDKEMETGIENNVEFKSGWYDRLRSIIKTSLFRIIEFRMSDNINDMLNSFLQSFFTRDENYISIIDIKYHEMSYFLDSKNIEKIKNISVRKQFVYEYLMQKEVKKFPQYLNQLKIRSSFWLPGYNQKFMFEEGETFMDGYIRMITVDFEMLAESYVSMGTKKQKKLTSENKRTVKNVKLEKLESDVKDWKVGDKVFHRTFGIGEVTHIFSNKDKLSLAVKFGNFSPKILDPKTIPLKRFN